MDKKNLAILILSIALVVSDIFIGVLYVKKINSDNTVIALSDLNTQLAVQSEQLRSKLELSRTEVISITDRNTQLGNDNSQLRDSNAKLIQIKSGLERAVAELERSNNRLQSSVAELTSTNSILRDRITAIGTTIGEAAGRIGRAENLIAEIITIFRELRTRFDK